MMQGRSISPGIPRAVSVLAASVTLIAVGLMFLGTFRVGATWDERIHAQMTQTFFETGWYASPDWLVEGQLDDFTGKWPYFVYAPVASLIAHAAAALVAGEPLGGFLDTESAYVGRHIGTALIASLGIIAVALIAKAITRSWKWGLLAAAVFASTPMWAGHGMFNVKDLPVAVGYTMSTLGFVLICRRGYSESKRTRLVAWAAIALGVVLAVGTRPASGLPIAITGLGLAAAFSLKSMFRTRWIPAARKWPGPQPLDSLGALTLGYLILLAIYPNAFSNPVRLVKETLLISGRFPVNDPELTYGVWLEQPPPWYYLPTWFGAQLTILALIAAGIFVLLSLVTVLQLARRSPNRPVDPGVFFMAVPVLAQAFLLPVLAIGVRSTMYDAVRQFLFVVPAMAILATLGIYSAVALLGRSKLTRGIVWAVVSLGLVVPVIDQIRLFPYNYVYFNEFTSLRPINGNWATDYWRASSRELVTLIPPGETSCQYASEAESFRPCADDSSFRPFWSDRGREARPGTLGPNEYWFVRENGGDIQIPDTCSLHNELTRPLRFDELVIAQILRCSVADSSLS